MNRTLCLSRAISQARWSASLASEHSSPTACNADAALEGTCQGAHPAIDRWESLVTAATASFPDYSKHGDGFSVPILMYHQISYTINPGFDRFVLTPDKFWSQMRWLAQAGYVSITIDQLLDARDERILLPAKPVVITFDDGFQDCVSHAVPILQALGFTATFYLVAGLMGTTSEWTVRKRGFELPLIDWRCARRLTSAGFQCGSHTMTHPYLAELSPEACRYELEESRLRLEDNLGLEVRHLAFPFGSYNEAVKQAAKRSGYRTACSIRSGLSQSNDDPLALHRVSIDGHDSLLDFICKLRTSKTLKDLFRYRVGRLLRRLKLIPERPDL